MGRISEDSFVEREIAHRLGTVGDTTPAFSGRAIERALAASSGMTLAWSSRDRQPWDLNAWRGNSDKPADVTNQIHGNAYKTQDALKAILAAGADFDFLLDMQDHRARAVADDGDRPVPVFSFNRRVGAGHGRILWPLPVFHDVRSSDFLGGLQPDRVPWADKEDRVVWRGGPGNRGRLGKYGRGAVIRLLPLLRRFAEGDLSEEETLRALRTMPRYKLMERFFDDPRFDIGYTEIPEIDVANTPFIQNYLRDAKPREAFQTYKYILVLPGSDVGSSLYWTMNSGSVPLVMDCDFETFGTCHFEAWKHYIPVARCLENVNELLDWCADNQDACQRIARNAAETSGLLGNADLRARANAGVIERVRSELPRTRRFPARTLAPPAIARAAPNPTPPKLSIFFIAQPPEYANMGLYLAASVRAMVREPVDLIGYVPASSADQQDPRAVDLYQQMRVDLRVFEDRGRFDPAYPHGNKILAALEPRRTPYSAFLDSDMVFIRPNSVEDLMRPGHVSVAPATSMYWSGQKIWEQVYGACYMPLPDARIWLARQRRRKLMPYFNSGLVAFPEGPVMADGRDFPKVWHDLAQAIDREDIVKKRPYLDQLSLPPAIIASGLNWHILPEEQHFILGGELRGEPLPPDREIVLLHYRNLRILREVGHLKIAKDFLEQVTGVRRISQVESEAALVDD